MTAGPARARPAPASSSNGPPSMVIGFKPGWLAGSTFADGVDPISSPAVPHPGAK